jgi:hypothetical protein
VVKLVVLNVVSAVTTLGPGLAAVADRIHRPGQENAFQTPPEI